MQNKGVGINVGISVGLYFTWAVMRGDLHKIEEMVHMMKNSFEETVLWMLVL